MPQEATVRSVSQGYRVIKPIERAAEARRTIEGADRLRERQLGGAAGE